MTACALVIVLFFSLFAGCSKSGNGGKGLENETIGNGSSEAGVEGADEGAVGVEADSVNELGSLARSAVANPSSTIAVGDDLSFAVRDDGCLLAWGSSTFLTAGKYQPQSKPRLREIMENVFTVSAGHTHSMAIRTDGSLWAWGNNKFGQLGDGSTKDRFAPVKILEDVIAVSAGAEHTMAVRTDDSLWVWGVDQDGRPGIGSEYSGYGYVIEPEPLKITEGMTAVSAGNYYSMACGADGGLWVLGGSKPREPGPAWSVPVKWGYPSDITVNVMSPPREFPCEWRPSYPEPFPGKIALVTFSTRYNDNADYGSAMSSICAAYTKDAIGEELGATFEPYAHNGRVYRHCAMGLMDYLVY